MYAPKKLCFVNCGLPADQCACYRQFLDETFLPTILATEHERLMAERDAEIVRLREAITALVKTHDRENFMRSADFHREDCRCLRCAFDRARAALGDDNE